MGMNDKHGEGESNEFHGFPWLPDKLEATPFMRPPLSGPEPSPQQLDHSMAPEPGPGGDALHSNPGKLPRALLVGAWMLVASVHLVLRPEQRLPVWPLGYMLLEALACASLAYRA